MTEWLTGIGLEFKPSKTRVTHTLHQHQGNVGFDFLGCTIRQVPVGKTRTGRTTSGQLLGFTTRITPSKEAITRHTADLGTVIRHHRTVSQEELIGLLNPKIRGWALYYRTVVSSAAYATCDDHLYQQLRRWCFRRHPTKGRQWIVRRSWRRNATRTWNFATSTGTRLRGHAEVSIRRHVHVRGTASPFDGNLPYWAQRRQQHPHTGALLGWLLAAQGGRCARCGLLLTLEDLVEIDHVHPTVLVGRHTPTPLHVLHRHCHDQKTAHDGSSRARPRQGVPDKDHMIEEPDEANVSRPVL